MYPSHLISIFCRDHSSLPENILMSEQSRKWNGNLPIQLCLHTSNSGVYHEKLNTQTASSPRKSHVFIFGEEEGLGKYQNFGKKFIFRVQILYITESPCVETKRKKSLSGIHELLATISGSCKILVTKVLAISLFTTLRVRRNSTNIQQFCENLVSLYA